MCSFAYILLSIVRLLISFYFDRRSHYFGKLFEMWTLGKSDLLLGRTASAEVASDPFLEILDVSDLLQVALHHVCVSRVYKDLLAIPHRLQKLLVILLLLYDRLFRAEILSLLTDLFLQDIVDSELSQLLLEHELVVLVAHVVLHLLLTALQLHHNLLVAHLDGLIVVSLARP